MDPFESRMCYIFFKPNGKEVFRISVDNHNDDTPEKQIEYFEKIQQDVRDRLVDLESYHGTVFVKNELLVTKEYLEERIEYYTNLSEEDYMSNNQCIVELCEHNPESLYSEDLALSVSDKINYYNAKMKFFNQCGDTEYMFSDNETLRLSPSYSGGFKIESCKVGDRNIFQTEYILKDLDLCQEIIKNPHVAFTLTKEQAEDSMHCYALEYQIMERIKQQQQERINKLILELNKKDKTLLRNIGGVS